MHRPERDDAVGVLDDPLMLPHVPPDLWPALIFGVVVWIALMAATRD